MGFSAPKTPKPPAPKTETQTIDEAGKKQKRRYSQRERAGASGTMLDPGGSMTDQGQGRRTTLGKEIAIEKNKIDLFDVLLVLSVAFILLVILMMIR